MTTYAVFANDAFWGAFDGADEVEAIQAAADEHGTDGNTDGMHAQDVNDYVLSVREGCESNGTDMAELAREFFNCAEAEVDAVGDIWIAKPQTGHWIDANKKADFLAWLAQ